VPTTTLRLVESADVIGGTATVADVELERHLGLQNARVGIALREAIEASGAVLADGAVRFGRALSPRRGRAAPAESIWTDLSPTPEQAGKMLPCAAG
jgi:hypothetical protein